VSCHGPLERYCELLAESVAVFAILLAVAIAIVTATLVAYVLLESKLLEKKREWPVLPNTLLTSLPEFGARGAR
jgi:hypothetical protein